MITIIRRQVEPERAAFVNPEELLAPAQLTPRPVELPEPLTLPDGRVVTFGLITPAAKELIQTAVASMSPQTSRHRFFNVRDELSELELDRLTDMDGHDRLAIGAAATRADGSLEGVGVARLHRVADRPDAAEMALVIVDAYQGQGIGKRLLNALSKAALVRGIVRFTGLVLSDNAAMIGLLRRHAPGRVSFTRAADEQVEFELQLAAPPAVAA